MLATQSFQTQLDDLLDRICVKLQISPSQHKVAEDRYTTIGNWLRAPESRLAIMKPNIYSQGSIRIGTTVKPHGRQEYDLDLVCLFSIDYRKIPNPVMLLDQVEARLREDETYRNILERKQRCIRIKYANAFHLDILPACPDLAKNNGCILVPDREIAGWKPSNPTGYANWFENRAKSYEISLKGALEPLPDHETADEKAPLKQAVQLIKRWRDIAYIGHTEEAPISIVLTTLAGYHYAGETSLSDGLSGILQRIVTGLPTPGHILEVRNPANNDEILSEKWRETPSLYVAFVRGINHFAETWRAIHTVSSIPAVTRVLEQLFGEETARMVVAEQAESIQKARDAKRLQVQNSSGLISILGSSRGTPIQRNTFHGE